MTVGLGREHQVGTRAKRKVLLPGSGRPFHVGERKDPVLSGLTF